MAEPTLEALREARQALDAVVEEIQQIPGFETFLAPPTFADVAVAAVEHPLVYLAAAEPGGLALVVRGEAVEEVDLPGLTQDALAEWVRDYLAAYTAYRNEHSSLGLWEQALLDVTRWLWDTVMGEVTRALHREPGTQAGRLPAASVVTGGLLGLLPLHAAWHEDPSRPTGREHALDLVRLAYAPNARALTAARAVAREVPGRRVYAVRAPRTSGLPLAGAETRAVQRAFPGGTVQRRPTAAGFLAALPAADVVHVACHGVADLDEPLNSRLELAPGEHVTLEMLLGQPMRVRLAVLSACETLLPGTELPDEVVSLPTGLIQSGAAGVLASMWAVDDLSSVILMIGFYERWRSLPDDPGEALRGAQVWLRDATHHELVEHIRGLGAAGGWVPRSVTEEILTELAVRAGTGPGGSRAGLADWAAFAHVGA